MRRAPVALLLAGTALGACTMCGSQELGRSSRVLATLPPGDGVPGASSNGGRTVEIEATLEGNRVKGDKLDLRGHPDWRVSHALKVTRGPAEEPVVRVRMPGTTIQPVFSAVVADREAGLRVLAALTVVQCRRGDDLLVHVQDAAGAYRAAPWDILYLLDGRTLATSFESPATTCAEATAAAPTLDALLDGAAREGQDVACVALVRLGRRVEALRCLMLGGEDPDAWHPLMAQVQSGDAEDDLYAALAISASWEHERWWPRRVLDLLGNTPDRPRRVRWVREMSRACAPGAPVPCATWRLRVVGRVAQPLGEPGLCDEVIALADRLLSTEGPDAADGTRELLQGIAPCGSVARLAPLVRRALTRPSQPRELEAGSGDPFLWNQCFDDSALNADAECRSLPRWAGSWLARHCDDAGVAAARAALGTTPATALDPLSNTIQDGALRVLGRCAPDAWRQVAGAHPDSATSGEFHAPVAAGSP